MSFLTALWRALRKLQWSRFYLAINQIDLRSNLELVSGGFHRATKIKLAGDLKKQSCKTRRKYYE